MKLHNVATFFDDIPVYDAYTGALLGFKAQFSSFDETDPDGSVSTSRSMSVHPGAVMPTRRVITLMGETWMLGEESRDGFQGEAIRKTVPMRRTTDLFKVLTPGQVISGAAGVSAYGRKDYYKDTVDGPATSDYFPFYLIALPSSETAPAKGVFFESGGSLYRCRSTYTSKDGVTIANSDLVPHSAVTVADFGSPVYDPVTDTYVGAEVRREVLVMPHHQFYRKTSEGNPSYMPGDLTLFTRLLDGQVQVGQQIKLEVDNYEWISPQWWSGLVPAQVLAVTSESDAWVLHIRRA